MDQEKIGKFICLSRKKKKMTQSQLAEKIGVSEKSVSNWENGRNMPDLSLFKPLCLVLDISLNDLLSGEKIDNDKYQEKLEENIGKAIDYSNKKVNDKDNLIGVILIVFGTVISLTAMSIFPSDSSWGSIYSVLGGIISLIGISRFTRKLKYGKRLLYNFSYFTIFILLLLFIDYVSVITLKQAPRFSYSKEMIYNMIIYKAPFYNVYRINFDTKNEYYIVDREKKYTKETVPNVPFDRDKSGIDNIIKYKNKYVGNNANLSNLINSLPLSEYGHLFEIDNKNLGIKIHYHITDWYIDDDLYLQRSLIYNSVSLFSLIDNLEYIIFDFSGSSYHTTRKQVENNYPNYGKIIKDDIDKINFNKYLEGKINDEDFVNKIFNSLFD